MLQLFIDFASRFGSPLVQQWKKLDIFVNSTQQAKLGPVKAVKNQYHKVCSLTITQFKIYLLYMFMYM